MTIKHRIFLSIPLTIVMMASLGSGLALAADDTFTQRILPLNCIFTVVNAGTGELNYVTPAECGVVVTTPSPSSHPGNMPTSSNGQQIAQSPAGPNQPLFFVPTPASNQNQNNNPSDNDSQLVWKPIATVASPQNNQQMLSSKKKASLSTTATIAIAGAGAGLFLVVVLVFFFI